MKALPLVWAAVMATAASVCSQEAASTSPGALIVGRAGPAAASTPTVSPVAPSAVIHTTAHILGNLSDGTPPPPAPPKIPFIVPRQDILATTIHQQGGRTITIQKIKPIALPSMPEPGLPASDVDVAAFVVRAAAYRATHPSIELICAGATVYHSKTSPARSLVRIWPYGDEEPVDFWSSADFGYLSGFPSFIGSDGNARSLFMMWTNADMDREARSKSMRGLTYNPPEIPEFPAGPASFAFVGKLPSDRIIASVQSLHDLYNNEFGRLKAAYEGRQRANLQREADLKAHPPQPKNIVLNYWRTETPAPVKGAAK